MGAPSERPGESFAPSAVDRRDRRGGCDPQRVYRFDRLGSVYSHYPFQVVSIDFVKGDRKRDNFIQHCPNFLIVDEAHGSPATAATWTPSPTTRRNSSAAKRICP